MRVLRLSFAWSAVAVDVADVTNLTVTASKYDNRSYVVDNDFAGCYDTGCLPKYVTVSVSEASCSCMERLDFPEPSRAVGLPSIRG